jgi:hypothetical protein
MYPESSETPYTHKAFQVIREKRLLFKEYNEAKAFENRLLQECGETEALKDCYKISVKYLKTKKKTFSGFYGYSSRIHIQYRPEKFGCKNLDVQF